MDKYYQEMIRDILAKELYDAKSQITRLEENEALLQDQLKTANCLKIIAENDLKEMVLEVGKVCQCGDGGCSVDGGDLD